MQKFKSEENFSSLRETRCAVTQEEEDMREYTGIGILFEEFLKYCIEPTNTCVTNTPILNIGETCCERSNVYFPLGRDDINHLTEFYPKAKNIYHCKDNCLEIGESMYEPKKCLNDNDFWVDIHYQIFKSSSQDELYFCDSCGCNESENNISTKKGLIFIPKPSDRKRRVAYDYNLWSCQNRRNIEKLLINDRTFKCSRHSSKTITATENDFTTEGRPKFNIIVEKCQSVWKYEVSEEEKRSYKIKADKINKEKVPIGCEGVEWELMYFRICIVCFYGWKIFRPKEFPVKDDEEICLIKIKNQLIKDKGYYIYMMLCYSIIENIIPKELIVELVHLRMQLLLKDFGC